MSKIRMIVLFFAVILLGGAIWRFWALKADLADARAVNAQLAAANQSNQSAIDALQADKAISEKALLSAVQAQAATQKRLSLIRKEIENAKQDAACLAADDRDRALARGVRDMLADDPN